jgi:ubiquinone/menaquinone biosynthesis C-methylase UbiE
MDKCRVNAILAAVGAGALVVWLCALWLRERRAKTVFPASDAAALLHPLRRLLQNPGATVEAIGIRDGDRVLELGPGPGYFTREAAPLVGEHGILVGADLQREMIMQLRGRVTGDGAARLRTIVADATRLPLASDEFDRVFLSAVLGEVPDAASAVSEIARVLRPSGVVAFCETLTDPDYVRERDLRRLCAGAGLRVVDHRRLPLGYIMRFALPVG